MVGKRTAWIVVALAITVWVSGCGSDNTSSVATTATTAGTTTTATTSTTTSTTTTATVRRVTLVFPRPTSTDFDFVPVERQVPSTGPVEVAALQALLAGPTPDEVSAQQVTNPFTYSQDIRVRSVTITNGTATADFSRELLAYGGGSANVGAIGGSITETLKRFPGVTKVVILVEGQPDQLQP